jgi:hypothetical protein
MLFISTKLLYEVHKFKIMENKRKCTWWSTNLPLTSERVRLILSNPVDSKKLAAAIRASRKGIKSAFKLCDQSSD